jgi:toxin-antitoxin system PIN domain toxin
LIAVDTNILTYAHRSESPHHLKASAALRGLAESAEAWAIPWPCIHEFLSVVTNPKVHMPPTPLDRAHQQIEIWMESPRLVLLAESDQHWEELREVVTAARIFGARIHDARIAAICLQHGVRELWSADRDFNRFPRLRVVNPLVDPRN